MFNMVEFFNADISSLDNFQNPALTKCGHSFCFDCVKELSKCPLCKATISKQNLFFNRKI